MSRSSVNMRTDLAAEVAARNRIVSVAEMQTLERQADAGGHSYVTMMEIAGRRVAEAILARYGRASCLVLAGPGNNGGDGLVCARYLHEAGAAVQVYLWKRPTDAERDYAGHLGRLVELGVPAIHADDDLDLSLLRDRLRCTVVVDALLGTGANRPVSGQLADILDSVRAAQQAAKPGLHVVAVDCASGLNCDSGALDPHAVAPDVTVTFAHAKTGHYLFPGAGAVGELIVADIGIDPELVQDARTFVLDADLIGGWLPERKADSHKGTFGRVMLAVGSERFPGAAYLACAAAGRSGAGLVTGALIRPVWSLVASTLPEPTYVLLPAQEDGGGAVIAPDAAAVVASASAGYKALVLGCGTGNTPATRSFVAELLAAELPATLIDADGLNCLAQLEAWPQRLPAQCVLTPHPAEMARLCGLPVDEILERRWDVARTMAAAWQCTVLLKGPYTVIAEPGGWLAVLPIATAALATAGTGDVLAGLIGGLLAQGLDPFRAACAGAWLHGTAGLRCAERMGQAGVVASDLLPELPIVQDVLRREGL